MKYQLSLVRRGDAHHERIERIATFDDLAALSGDFGQRLLDRLVFNVDRAEHQVSPVATDMVPR